MIIIQCRSGSTRLPNKAMMDIKGMPMINYIYNKVSGLDFTIVATPTHDPICEHLRTSHIPYYEGSESDVLARYRDCMIAYQAPYIIRLTADCPLIDPSIIFFLKNIHIQGKFDYTTNLPTVDGYDTELISPKLIEFVYQNASTPEHREHVTQYIRDKGKFLETQGYKFFRYVPPYKPEWFPKLSIDTQEDYDRISKYVELL